MALSLLPHRSAPLVLFLVTLAASNSPPAANVAPANPPKVVPANAPKVAPANPQNVAPANPPKVVPANPPKIVPANPPDVVAANPPNVAPVNPPKVVPANQPNPAPVAPSPTPAVVSVAGHGAGKYHHGNGHDQDMIGKQSFEHIKSHILEEVDEVNANVDSDFFFFSLSDLDGDKNLDGLELLHWVINDHQDHNESLPNPSELEKMTDDYMILADKDRNGLISFAEYKTAYTVEGLLPPSG